MRTGAAFSMTLSTSSTRGRSSIGGAFTGSSLAFWHRSHCVSLQGGYVGLIQTGGVSGELLLLFLFEVSVVHVKHKPGMETSTIVSVEHLVPFMNGTMLVQRELSLLSQYLLVWKFLRRGEIP